MKLDGKVVVVTGASRVIGKAVAKLFAEEGAKMVVTARSVALPRAAHAVEPDRLGRLRRRLARRNRRLVGPSA